MQYIAVIHPHKISEIFTYRQKIIPCIIGFKISYDGHLYLPRNIKFPKGFYMMVSFDGDVSNYDIKNTAAEIIKTCINLGCSAVVLNTTPSQAISSLISALCECRQIKIYAPINIKSKGNFIRLVPTAVSGGSLKELLQFYCNKFGCGNTAILVDITRCDFTLPALNGKGRNIILDETKNLIEKYKAPSFYSDDLEINYFSYRRDNKMHMVLYDNSHSIKRKIALAEKFGIKECFFSYEETKYILNKII